MLPASPPAPISNSTARASQRTHRWRCLRAAGYDETDVADHEIEGAAGTGSRSYLLVACFGCSAARVPSLARSGYWPCDGVGKSGVVVSVREESRAGGDAPHSRGRTLVGQRCVAVWPRCFRWDPFMSHELPGAVVGGSRLIVSQGWAHPKREHDRNSGPPGGSADAPRVIALQRFLLASRTATSGTNF